MGTWFRRQTSHWRDRRRDVGERRGAYPGASSDIIAITSAPVVTGYRPVKGFPSALIVDQSPKGLPC
jgi:hypothetical protein